MKRQSALLIAFHFPPLGESSGLQRTLSLANDLAKLDWSVIVLTVTSNAYRHVRMDQIGDVDPRVRVVRAFAVDSSRAFSIKGKYPRALALPDVWSSWLVAGTLRGLWLIFRHRPAFIWSTYPIATAHLLGLVLAASTRSPWIADFRDSMTEEEYPSDPVQRRAYVWIERATIARAHRSIFTTDGALEMYASRYPAHANRFCVIPNGFEERYFRQVGPIDRALTPRGNGPVVLLHSGVVYPSERDPSHLFRALSELKGHGLGAQALQVVFRASGSEELFRRMTKELGIEDMIVFAPSVDYREALSEMTRVDGLLVLQAANCNHQIPAKIYEYIRSGTPIIALTDARGDTAKLVERLGDGLLCPLDDSEAISETLRTFVDDTLRGRTRPARLVDAQQFSRIHHARALLGVVGDPPEKQGGAK